MRNMFMKCGNCSHRVIEFEGIVYHVSLLRIDKEGVSIRLTKDCNFPTKEGPCNCGTPINSKQTFEDFVNTNYLPTLPKDFGFVNKK